MKSKKDDGHKDELDNAEFETVNLIPVGEMIKVMAEFMALSPIWHKDIACTVEELGASEDLCKDLYKWSEWYNERGIAPNVVEIGQPSFSTMEEAERFDRRGLELAKRLKKEVGDRYTITYHGWATGKQFDLLITE